MTRNIPVSMLLIATLLALVLLIPKVSAQAEPEPTDADEPPMTVEEILKRDPSDEDYKEDERCIRTDQIRNIDIIDDKHIAFEVRRNQYYMVQFERRCLGLRRNSTVVFEPIGNRLCRLDGIRPIDEWGGIPGAKCTIPGFESVTKEQIVMLKEALQAERRKKRDA